MSNIMRPFSLVPVFGDLEREFSRLLNPDFESSVAEISDWQPKVDVIEENKQFVIKVDVPGVDPKNVEVNFDRNALTIKGEKDVESEEKKGNFIRYERSKGSFYRRIVLPDVIDESGIVAKGKNGVLIVTVPKSDTKVSKRIEVQDG